MAMRLFTHTHTHTHTRTIFAEGGRLCDKLVLLKTSYPDGRRSSRAVIGGDYRG